MTLSPMSPPPQPQTAEAAEARQKARETLTRTSALVGNPDFQWFMATCVREKIVEANGNATSLARTPQERDYAVHVHDALLKVYGWVEDSFTDSQAAVNSQA